MNHYNEFKELLHAKYFRFAGETGVDAAGLLLCGQREGFGSNEERFLGKMNGYLKRYVVKLIL